jgi:hypothetical protein
MDWRGEDEMADYPSLAATATHVQRLRQYTRTSLSA